MTSFHNISSLISQQYTVLFSVILGVMQSIHSYTQGEPELTLSYTPKK
jgi:hypothetical protein